MLLVVYANPKFLYLLLLIPSLVGWYIYRLHKSRAALVISTAKHFDNTGKSVKVYLRHLPFALRMLALALAIIALARPQSTNIQRNVTTEGIDIVLSLDVSGSMLARDFKPDRLEAAKSLGINFISGRANDRIGLVIFAGESFTLCPLTTDRATLINQFKAVDIGVLEDGTAIGSGLATAISRLKDSDAKSKVIILLTDGVNNRGEIAPMTAAEMAKTFGIRVYTIGVGTYGTAPYPVQTPFGTRYQDVQVEIDEDLLKSIAQMTGGEYFRAINNKALEQVYQKIDQLEKSKIEVNEYAKREEKYRGWLLAAFILLLLEFVLRRTYLLGI
ncbi:MAG TPA: VWA domain-containing protein [Tenuifilum sp.]|jgi:Ca-activated chloride channel family protein|uniref:vWA domain-containing protein n=2 Tax=Tenuifilum sp. TaxID=2760880 RepID=UPI001B7C14DB|nr:VWA domain-containing protein [Bacteroidales bacterium]HOU74249.1 VWA domain-containing protein [Tenuifilum sp.]HQG71762.1 VWA domain-containing protein [Tenuifilum sp.]HQI88001.1 VWA domain-containing protein [Tenuifilum sp.]HRS43618.1 VWA domain-containing protein [Tenuifilum sp.]